MEQERKHPPTANRLAQARLEGECFHSAQLAIVLYSMGAVVGLLVGAAGLAALLARWTTEFWAAPVTGQPQSGELEMTVWEIVRLVGVPVAGALFALWCGAWVAYLWQTGWMWGRKPVASLASLAPAARWAQWFSGRRLVGNLLGVAQAVAVVSTLMGLAWWRGDTLQAFWLDDGAPWEAHAGALLKDWVAPILGVMLGVALIDFVCQRAIFRRSLRMTDEQLRDELRQERRK